jgi:hypothetical protein
MARSRKWALGLGLVGFFGMMLGTGIQQVKADDVQDYGTVIGIVRCFTSPTYYLPFSLASN